jgi:hypothetical protein
VKYVAAQQVKKFSHQKGQTLVQKANGKTDENVPHIL